MPRLDLMAEDELHTCRIPLASTLLGGVGLIYLQLARVFLVDDGPHVGIDPIENLCGELYIISQAIRAYIRALGEMGRVYRTDVVEVCGCQSRMKLRKRGADVYSQISKVCTGGAAAFKT